MGRFVVFSLLACLLGGLYSCADDTEVGSGLLDSEDLEVVFTDDFELVMRHVPPSPFDVTLAQFYSLGTVDNTIFGRTKASFYVRPFLDAFTRLPDFAGGTLDSMVLALKIDTTRYYGNPESLYNVEVFELIESIDDIDTFRTDQEFMINPNPLGSVPRLVPAKLDSIATFDPLGDTTYFYDVLTIPLDRRFAAGIFLDTLRNDDRTEFLNLLYGLYVTATSNNSILQVDLTNEISSMLVYYKDSSGLSITYPYKFSSNAPINFSFDLSGSDLEAALDDPNPEYFYIQGHGGAMVEVDIDDVNKLQNPFINHVSLEVYAEKDGLIDTSFFPLPFALDLLRLDENGEFVSVIDLAIGQEQGQTRGIFGGELQVDAEKDVIKYEMNITTHVKEILQGRQSSKMFITVRNRIQTPNNLVIYGPDHPVYPARLKLTYTKS